ncbi:thioesterase family protein [Kribbella sp. NPDC051770]|uniref:acyl-CoA thioesterase n=1 Tax=Kribbella sp. NPDC051770 TaxID=3155413 RepID=UPI003413610F
MDRSAFPHFHQITTRWKDNDVYGHVNNVEYYSFFDTVINEFLIRAGGLDIHAGPVIGLCVESQCTFKAPLAFPDTVDAGLRVAKLGTSSVTYEIGLFRGGGDRADGRSAGSGDLARGGSAGGDEPAALGRFVHVFVDRGDRRPTPLPAELRSALEGITG